MNPTTNFTEEISRIYELDNQRRQKLSDMLDVIINGQASLDMEKEVQHTCQLKDMINNETFKVLVLGEFNTGKSTFINALLGNEVLPTKAVPATAIINLVKYGEKPLAKVHFKNPDKHPQEVPIDRLGEFVLIQSEKESDAQAEIRESPFSHAEIFWPLELCRENNVEIIDSPGLNENKVREDVTIGYLQRVDAVLFIMAAVRFGPAQTEMDTINMLETAGHKDLFFVVNQWDLLRKRQREEVGTKAKRVLKELTNRKEDIYFVSAQDAMEGRMDQDPELEARSGFKEMEAALHEFLANERGRIKALRAARELKRVIRKMEREVIPTRRKLLQTPLKDLECKYQETQKNLHELQTNKSALVLYASRQRKHITESVRERTRAFFINVDTRVEEWAEDYDLQVGLAAMVQKSKIEESMREMNEHLAAKLKTAFKDWQKEQLTPFIEDSLEDLKENLNNMAQDFEDKLQQARLTLSGNFESFEVEDSFGPKNALERILAAAGGWFVGGIGAGAIGAMFGYKEMLKALIPNVAAIIGAIIVGLPVLPLILIVSIFQGVRAFDSLPKKIKESISQKFKQTLKESSSEQAIQISNQLDQQLGDLVEALEAGMNNQIEEVKEQAEVARNDHQKGEAEVQNKLSQIEVISKELESIQQESEAFIEELV